MSKLKLITNSKESNLLDTLLSSFENCKKFYFNVAFINYSGIQLLLNSLKELEERNIEGKILTSTYLNFTEPKALQKLKEFQNLNLKIFVTTENIGFHSKAYIFEYEDSYKFIIGSSNITQSALKSNIEWNIETISKDKSDYFSRDILSEFDKLWQSSVEVDSNFLLQYEKFFKNSKESIQTFEISKEIEPNEMQKEALKNLKALREFNHRRALIIASTGTGKTFLSAFDVKAVNPKKLLFLIHNRDILNQAKKSFESIIRDKTIGIFSGERKESANYLFATIQTLSKDEYLNTFSKEYFDYIIIDEAHRALSKSYSKVINYFEPKFMLGMSATPDKFSNDGKTIFDIFENIAIDVRLRNALEQNLIVPFHYFGISDFKDVDLEGVDLNNIELLSRKLQVNGRARYIKEKMDFYGFDGDKRKAIGFCASIEHAKFMANEFNRLSIPSIALTGANSIDERKEYIQKLESESDELEVIFTVDIFNEGVDIPSINTILMLRPTTSSIIFTQQLGRGLRKYKSKKYLTLLDFIANHDRAFLIAISLNGNRFYNKRELIESYKIIPNCSHIFMDRVVEERILNQIENTNFNHFKFLKDEYFEIKKLNRNSIPTLMDFIKFDSAPEPIKFIKHSKSFIEFIKKVEKLEKFDDDFIAIIRQLNSLLPLKRVYEFVIIKMLIERESFIFENIKFEVSTYIDIVREDTIKHSIDFLSQKFADSKEKRSSIILIEEIEGRYRQSKKFSNILKNENYKSYILDTLHYGIERYKIEFSRDDYGYPFLKLYYKYSMFDTALLSEYKKTLSSFRGSGIKRNENNYFLFVTMQKDENDKIKHINNFSDRELMRWESLSNTSQESESGQNLINNRERGINLHLFVRKYREVDGEIQPFIYLGKVDTHSYSGNKPIIFQMKLRNRVPMKLYGEFIS